MLSFTYLKALAVDFLKIGGHYVRGVVDDPVYGTIVTAVNQVGRLMGAATIAEEVDTEPVLNRLRNLGIGYAQDMPWRWHSRWLTPRAKWHCRASRN